MSRRRGSVAVLVALAALLAVAVLAPTAGLSQTTEATPDSVTVTAAGKVEGRPDLAVVSFGVKARGTTAEATMNELSARQNGVIDALRATGLAEDEITTGNISLNESCRYDRELRRTVCEGFVAHTSVRAETRDLEAIGEVIDAGVAGGASSVNNVSFDRTEENEAIKEALAQAMDLAIAKAQVLATRAGRTLGRAIVIEEGGAQRPVLRSFDVAASTSGTSAARGLVINPPDQLTKVRIVVTFALN